MAFHLGIVALAFNPSIWERQVDCYELKVSQSYMRPGLKNTKPNKLNSNKNNLDFLKYYFGQELWCRSVIQHFRNEGEGSVIKSLLQLHSELEASLSCLRPCLKSGADAKAQWVRGCQAWRTDADPWNTHGRKRALTLTLPAVYHTNAMACTPKDTHNKQCKKIAFIVGASDMVQWVESLATKPDDLRLIPRTHKVEGEEPAPASFPLTSTCTHRYRKM